MSAALELLIVVGLFSAACYLPVEGDTCVGSGPRVDCGEVGTNQLECENQGCCWQPTEKAGEPWCFFKTPEDSCVSDAIRVDCGEVGTTEDQCTGKGCCWQASQDPEQPWCFYKTPDACKPDEPRSDCGYVGTTDESCMASGCCWMPSNTDGEPWCFHKPGSPPSGECQLNPEPRYDCGYVGVDQAQCESKGCCWNPGNEGEPWCFYKMPFYTVSKVEQTTLGVRLTLETYDSPGYTGSLPYSPNISPVIFELSEETDDRLHFKFYDPSRERWEVPKDVSPVPDPPSQRPSNQKYSYDVPEVGQRFFFRVKRSDKPTDVPLFYNDGYRGLLQFADQYLQLSTRMIHQHNIYGLGERVDPFRLNPGNIYTIWAYDILTPPHVNLYGAHPFYIEHRVPSRQSHGVFLRNSNAMDVLLDDDLLTYKVIGGILDFYIFLGPEPESVIQQYQEVIGRPQLPPYWSLGFHNCRFGYPNVETLDTVVDLYAQNQIPLDGMWTDIEYMDGYRVFTLDPYNFPAGKMNDLVNKLHNNGQHYVVVVDPGIKIDSGYSAYDEGINNDLFIKDSTGDQFVGNVWPGYVHYPDFLNPNTQSYWENQLSNFLKLLPVDGIWLDMNEASNFCAGECPGYAYTADTEPFCTDGKCADTASSKRPGFNPNNPPYDIHNQGSQSTPLKIKTLDVDAQHYGGVLEYDAHSIYGISEAIATRKALEKITGKRAFIVGRSTFPGAGAHQGHWTGDNHAFWEDLYNSIPGMLNFQLFGVPYVGADICGFQYDTTEELCSRWMELGAFYPFSRTHNIKGAIPQEPYVWPSVAAISRKVLAIRYSLLPYYYTLFYKANQKADSQSPPSATVTRPLFFEFPDDSTTFVMDRQFMVGSGLLISPVLIQGATTVSAYFPRAKWYNWYDLTTTRNYNDQPQYIDLYTPIDHIQIHIRGGSIIPLQGPALTTTASRQNDYSLIVALDNNGQAQGDLFLDDGESIQLTDYLFIDYVATSGQLQTTVTTAGSGYAGPPLDKVTIVGVTGTPTSAQINGQNIANFSFDAATKVITLDDLDASMDAPFTITWV